MNEAMTRSLKVVFLVLCLTALGLIVRNAVRDIVPAQPIYGWFYEQQQTIALKPGEFHNAWSIAPNTRIKIDIAAKLPVAAGLAPNTVELAATTGITNNPSAQLSYILSGSECGSNQILQAVFDQCQAREPSQVYVLDTRTAVQTAITATAGVVTRSESAIDRAIEPNEIILRLYSWRCTENCGGTQ